MIVNQYQLNKENIKSELLDGKIVYMSPRPAVMHNEIASNIYSIFRAYLKGKKCRPYNDGIEVHLTKKDIVIPDVMVICNRDIIKKDGVYGTPDFIAEVISPSTRKNDRGYKKNLYEQCGVKEYWIIEPAAKSIEVHLLTDGKYELDTYAIYPDWYLEKMTDEEKSEYITEFKTSLYDDLTISLNDIFYDLISDE